MIRPIVSLTLLFVLLISFQVLAQSEQKCSILNATTTLNLINTETLIPAGSNQHISFVSNKILQVNLSVVDNGAVVNKNYNVPVRLVRDTFVADFNKAVLVPPTEGGVIIYSALTSNSRGLFFMTYNTSQVTDGVSHPSNLIFKSFGSETMDIVGRIIAVDNTMEDRRWVIIRNQQNQIEKVDLKTGVHLPYFNQLLEQALDANTGTGIIMPDGERVLVLKSSNVATGTYTLSLVSSTMIEELTAQTHIENGAASLKLSNGEIIHYTNASREWRYEGVAQGLYENQVRVAQFTFDMIKNHISLHGNYLTVISRESRERFVISAAKVKCNLKTVDTSDLTTTALKKIGGAESCQKLDENVEAWDQAFGSTPAQLETQPKLTFADVDYLLQRMLRQDSLSKFDREVLDMAMQNPVLAGRLGDLSGLVIQKFSQQIRYKALRIFENFLIPLNEQIKGKFKDICMTNLVRERISSTYKELILAKLKKAKADNSNGISIQHLLFIKPYLNILTEQHKEDIAYDAGTLLAEATQSAHPEMRNVFFSTLDWMSTQKAKEMLGLKSSRLTDFIFDATQSNGWLYILGTDDVYADGDLVNSNSIRARGGFYILTGYTWIDAIINTKTYSWMVGNEQFQADLTKVARPVQFVPPLPTEPNKAELLDDKALYGMVVIGSNIRGEVAESLRDNYVYYLDSQGFLFYEPKEIPDTIDYLKKRISGREEKLDFFLKEAHSDGDHRNLFSINKKMFLIRAEKQNGDILEVVDIVVHDNTYEPVFISNQEFGSWLKIREDEKLGGQFIYLNTSCSSYLKAAAELGSAASKNLVIIASANSVYTFSTSETNSTYHLFDGMLKLNSFEVIAKASAGKEGEYIFPHQEKYKELVLSKINAGFDVVTRIFKVLEDGTRQIFQIEQEINHTH